MKNSPNYSDTALLTLIKNDQDLNLVIRFIYEQYSAMISAHVLKNSGTRQDAEDIFQDTVVSFIEIVRKDKFRGDSSIGTFLMSMAKNSWLNELKRRTRASLREEQFQHSKEIQENDISAFLVDQETKKQFKDILGRLGENCKKILLLYYYQNLSMKEIVSHLPYENEQVVRNKKYKCLQQLSDLLRNSPAIRNSFNYPHE
ncbi:RNA polymerase sigma factor [Pseudoflavitalea rhizosphaerae]|uniref:RNA polymerase sigma factor n=1 Tax=Pseudoflavitalea rhizosphaerae TaxID=1884793 RepID=UPI000F8F13A9|nr:sigma-70 family RNA polymerase sigma factor [Pseudoflavitalea rhizosphaerae]